MSDLPDAGVLMIGALILEWARKNPKLPVAVVLTEDGFQLGILSQMDWDESEWYQPPLSLEQIGELFRGLAKNTIPTDVVATM